MMIGDRHPLQSNLYRLRHQSLWRELPVGTIGMHVKVVVLRTTIRLNVGKDLAQ
jgi:hypothetical protein